MGAVGARLGSRGLPLSLSHGGLKPPPGTPCARRAGLRSGIANLADLGNLADLANLAHPANLADLAHLALQGAAGPTHTLHASRPKGSPATSGAVGARRAGRESDELSSICGFEMGADLADLEASDRSELKEAGSAR